MTLNHRPSTGALNPMPHQSPEWQISALLAHQPELLIGTFAPSRLAIFDLYEHIAALFHLVLNNLGANTHPTTIALGVPVRGPHGELRVNFPVYEALGPWVDARITAFTNKAKEHKLSFLIDRCAVGASFLSLTKNEDGKTASPGVVALVKEDAERSKPNTWLCLPEPETRYKSVFGRSWINGGPTKFHCIYPIILDRYVCAAFAIDTAGPLPPLDGDNTRLLLNNISRQLTDFYHAYYSALRPTGSERSMSQPEANSPSTRLLEWSVTGKVLNRKYYDRLASSLEHWNPNGPKTFPAARYLLLLFCDCDGIKRLNDAYGHHAGNEVIQLLGRVLFEAALSLQKDRQCGVSNGIVMQWGGDEFVVCLGVISESQPPETVASAYRGRATRHLRKLQPKVEKYLGRIDERHKFVLKDGIGLSIGWARWAPGDGYFQLAGADQAMYVAKVIRAQLRTQANDMRGRSPEQIFMIDAKTAEKLRSEWDKALTQ
jgi:diguanylate cyclase (GGDEF)-like protein